MATKDIKGITIAIGGDASGLNKALESVNTEVNETQKNLKEINKALKLDPTNTELLEQKQKALAKAVEATTEKLGKLKEIQKEAAQALADGKISQAQYDALTREITFTEAALKKATKAQQEFNATAAQLDVVAGKAEAVADKTKGISLAAAGALTAIGGLAINAAATADELNTMAIQTGLSTEELQKMQYAAERVDVSTETIAGSMSKLKRAITSNSKDTAAAFDKIGVSVRDASGQYKSADEVFYASLEGLSRIKNETERDALAMQLFGRSADELATIIDDGGAALKAYGQEAEDLGLILDQQTLDGLNAVNDEIDRLKATAAAELLKTGASALQALTPVIEGVISALSKVLEVIGNLSPTTIGIIAGVLAIVAAISPVAGIIGTISSAISTLLTFMPAIEAAFAAVTAFAAANPIVLIAAAVVALVALIVANWDKIKAIIEKVRDKVVEIFDKIKDAVKDKVNAILGFINSAIEAVNSLIAKINDSRLAGALGINIGTVGTLPMMANGGVLTSGSAIVGERGAELLSMSNGKATVTPLNTTTTTINNINNTSRQPVQVQLVCDGATLANALYDPMQKVASNRGPQFVGR